MIIVKISPNIMYIIEKLYIQAPAPDIRANTLNDTRIGQGLWSTTWNGWRIIILFKIN